MSLRLTGLENIDVTIFRSKVEYVLERNAYETHPWPNYFGVKNKIFDLRDEYKLYQSVRRCPLCHKSKIIFHSETGLNYCLACREVRSGLQFIMESRLCDKASALAYLDTRLKRFFMKALTDPLLA